MTITVTGHRPDLLSISGPATSRLLISFARDQLTRRSPDLVYSGMALGWDQAVAEACHDLRIPWIAAVPFDGQEKLWPEPARDTYHYLLADAEEVVVVSPGGYAARKFYERNHWMVDRLDPAKGDYVLALWNGRGANGKGSGVVEKGGGFSGTTECVVYARGKGVREENCWEEWQEALRGLKERQKEEKVIWERAAGGRRWRG